jgi:D-glycero-alpha-D-manno-heptose-7-phosphate kinase
VSNSDVDTLYTRAQNAGAIGGKLTGAGGGGFLLLFVEPGRHEEVRAELSELIHVPFKFDFQGSQIIYYEPEEDYSAIERTRAQQTIRPFRELSSLPERKPQ